MNYEEKYNQTIESIKRIYEQADSFGKELMEKEFPELRESDDERIRKELIERFNWELKGAEEQDAAGCSRQKDIAMFKRGLAWLEKQGEKMSDPRYSILAKLIEADDIYQMSVNYAMVEEAKNKSIEALSNLEISKLLGLEKQCEQKTEIEYIYPKFRIGDVIIPIKPNGYYPPVRVLSIEKKTKSYYCESDDHKHYSSIPIRCEDEYKLVEKNLAWSEKEKQTIEDAACFILSCVNTAETKKDEERLEELVNKLQDLRPYNHWKPSEFQLECLNKVIPHNNTEKDCELEDVLTELYNDLKNL